MNICKKNIPCCVGMIPVNLRLHMTEGKKISRCVTFPVVHYLYICNIYPKNINRKLAA